MAQLQLAPRARQARRFGNRQKDPVGVPTGRALQPAARLVSERKMVFLQGDFKPRCRVLPDAGEVSAAISLTIRPAKTLHLLLEMRQQTNIREKHND